MIYSRNILRHVANTNIGDNGVQYNRVSLKAPDDYIPGLSPEPLPEKVTNRPSQSIYETVTLKTPMVAKPREVKMDVFSANDQDKLREAWMAGIPERLRKGYVDKTAVAERRPVSAEVIRLVLNHLAIGPDTVDGIAQAAGVTVKGLERVTRELRDRGLIMRKFGANSFYCLTNSGAALEIKPGAKTEAIYEYLQTTPATQAEIRDALKLGQTVMENALRELRLSGRVASDYRGARNGVKTYWAL